MHAAMRRSNYQRPIQKSARLLTLIMYSKLPTADSKKRAPFDLNYLFGCVKAAWRHCRDPFDYAAWGGGVTY